MKLGSRRVIYLTFCPVALAHPVAVVLYVNKHDNDSPDR